MRLPRWITSWRRSWRHRARTLDAKVLWPSIWADCRCSALRFICAAAQHTAQDPNWNGRETEWMLSPVDPAVWVAKAIERLPRP